MGVLYLLLSLLLSLLEKIWVSFISLYLLMGVLYPSLLCVLYLFFISLLTGVALW